MSNKNKNKKLSRNAPTKAASTPAAVASKPGTPPAPSAPEVPAAIATAGGQSSDVVSAIEPDLKAALAGDKSAQERVNKVMEETMPRRGGAAFFIPPQKPSVFGKQS